jgi:phosphoribosylglycinamide formyltransferase-1
MISGGGRSLMNLHACCSGTGPAGVPRVSARVELVIASGPCAGAERARVAGIETLIIPGVIPPEALGRELSARRIDLVVLAGYLKLLRIPAGFEHRCVNIHPALLPAFGGKGMYGHHAHAAVLASGAKVSGCTVHMVDERYDTGPILLQRTCPVLDDPRDTPESLAQRVFGEELIALPTAVHALATGRVAIRGGSARVSGDGPWGTRRPGA